jgi:hypothetical protein
VKSEIMTLSAHADARDSALALPHVTSFCVLAMLAEAAPRDGSQTRMGDLSVLKPDRDAFKARVAEDIEETTRDFVLKQLARDFKKLTPSPPFSTAPSKENYDMVHRTQEGPNRRDEQVPETQSGWRSFL